MWVERRRPIGRTMKEDDDTGTNENAIAATVANREMKLRLVGQEESSR